MPLRFYSGLGALGAGKHRACAGRLTIYDGLLETRTFLQLVLPARLGMRHNPRRIDAQALLQCNG
jgi:hypothetical protein